jgi:neutral ceramidase
MRRRRLVGLLIASVILASLAVGPLWAQQPMWKVGVAAAKITPEKPLWLAGYGGRDRPAEGTLHDLWIKVLALEDENGSRAVLVTSDLLGFPKGMSETMCAELSARCGLHRSQIMLTASHTHTGPVLEDALYDIYPLDESQKAMIEEYSLALEKTVVATAAEALDGLGPAALFAAEGTADFAVNRRNNREAQVPELRKRNEPLKGPVEHSVPVLAVRTADGRLRAVVFSYACHATTLSFYQWSGDYPGFAQLALEEKHPDALAMFHAGCGADQNPLPRRTVELCQAYGQKLADAVQEVLGKPMRPITPRLRTALEIVNLDFGEQPDREALQAHAAQGGYRGRWAGRLLARLDAGQSFAPAYPYPVQVWMLGDDQLWIALGGEVVVDYCLRFKDTYGPHTWVTGYANDVMSYIPSGRVREEGGYEAGAFYVYGLPAERWAPDIEQRIAACVGRLVAGLRQPAARTRVSLDVAKATCGFDVMFPDGSRRAELTAFGGLVDVEP